MTVKGKHSKESRNKRKLILVATGIIALVLLSVVGAAAAVGAASDPTERIPTGFEVGGVDLAGMDISTARERLHREVEEPLDESIEVLVDGRPVESVSRRDLGATTNAGEVFSEAVSGFSEMSLFDRLRLRLGGESSGRQFEVTTAVEGSAVEEFAGNLAEEVHVPAEDASVRFAGNSVRVVPGSEGFELDQAKAVDLLTSAVEDPAVRDVDLPGTVVQPARTEADFRDVIVVKVGENKLLHFQAGNLVKTYDVATGLPSYPTPIGEFEIVRMRHRPTWVNPAKSPGRWGENLPARIGPGPDNPLGTRAMNLNVPNIRIHGTSSDWSLGYNASHGCIRMSISDSEELFERVGVGTKVIGVRSGSDRLAPDRNTEPSVEDLVESNGTAAEELQEGADPEQKPESPAPAPVPDSAAPVPDSAAPDGQEETKEPDESKEPEQEPVEDEPAPNPAEELRSGFDMEGA
ncbi:MAG: L,D-transpeptidase family protein [Actinobacteria bacterium]|nr:L,D-transpeptidase family protein [Actinomycetota bacterium]